MGMIRITDDELHKKLHAQAVAEQRTKERMSLNIDLFEGALLNLIAEFEEDNWKRIHPKGSPRPSGNQFNFADFCNWLHDRIEAKKRVAT